MKIFAIIIAVLVGTAAATQTDANQIKSDYYGNLTSLYRNIDQTEREVIRNFQALASALYQSLDGQKSIYAQLLSQLGSAGNTIALAINDALNAAVSRITAVVNTSSLQSRLDTLASNGQRRYIFPANASIDQLVKRAIPEARNGKVITCWKRNRNQVFTAFRLFLDSVRRSISTNIAATAKAAFNAQFAAINYAASINSTAQAECEVDADCYLEYFQSNQATIQASINSFETAIVGGYNLALEKTSFDFIAAAEAFNKRIGSARSNITTCVA